MLYSYRQIDDAFVICCRLPYIKNCVAYFQCIFRFCSGKALRRILQDHFSVIIGHIILYHIDAIDRDLLDLLAVHMEYNITL